jgi:hypothetical protein
VEIYYLLVEERFVHYDEFYLQYSTFVFYFNAVMAVTDVALTEVKIILFIFIIYLFNKILVSR